jgi:hypothetical protein
MAGLLVELEGPEGEGPWVRRDLEAERRALPPPLSPRPLHVRAPRVDGLDL